MFKKAEYVLELYRNIFTEKKNTFTAFMDYFSHMISGSDNIIFSPTSVGNLWNEQFQSSGV